MEEYLYDIYFMTFYERLKHIYCLKCNQGKKKLVSGWAYCRFVYLPQAIPCSTLVINRKFGQAHIATNYLLQNVSHYLKPINCEKCFKGIFLCYLAWLFTSSNKSKTIVFSHVLIIYLTLKRYIWFFKIKIRFLRILLCLKTHSYSLYQDLISLYATKMSLMIRLHNWTRNPLPRAKEKSIIS